MSNSKDVSSHLRFFNEPARHIALVTGGSRGIGQAIAQELRQCGIHVLTPNRGELDLSSTDSVQRFLNQSHGEIDILVNNAGINVINSIEGISPNDWEEMIKINLTAPFRLIQAFAPSMRRAKWGRILNISSIFGIVTKEKRAPYSATKAGLNGLTRTSAVELGPDGILVNSLCPGYVDTDLTRQNNTPEAIRAIQQTIPLRKMTTPAEIARTALFLLSDYNTYITGQTIVVDGGFTCL